MNARGIKSLGTTCAWASVCCLAASPVRADQIRIAGTGIEATPAVLEEMGICMEGGFGPSGFAVTIRIPMISPVGKAVDFYMRSLQGVGAPLTTSMLLSEFDGEWAPPIYAKFVDLLEPESRVVMHVGYVSEANEELTQIQFSNFQLVSLLSVDEGDDDPDKVYRVGCRKWDSDKSEQQTPSVPDLTK